MHYDNYKLSVDRRKLQIRNIWTKKKFFIMKSNHVYIGKRM